MDYQQPIQQPKKSNAFVTASLILGVLAFATVMTGFLPLFFGSLSILFAILAHRRGKRMETPAFVGVIASSVAMAFSVVLITIAITLMPTMLRDPTYREQLNTMSETMYGITFDEVLEEGYGIDLDEVLGIEE